MNMKVLHVAETIKGGVASVLNQLISSQNEIEICCILPDSQADEIYNNKKILLKQFQRSGRNIKSLLALANVFRVTLKEFKPDIIHLHSSFAGVICRFLLFFMPLDKKTKVIYCPHAFSFLMNVSSFKKYVYSFIERLLSLNTDAIICTSNYERNMAIQYGLKKDKLFVVYNGIQEPIVNIDDDMNPFDSHKINILYVGRFDYQKGIDILFDIINAAGTKYHFTLVGDTVHDSFNRPELASVTYTGWLNSKQLAKYYKYADVTIMPSRWESFGLVAAESNSYGTPVIASNSSSLPEVVVDGATGYLFDLNDFQKALDILNIKTKEDWNSMKEKCLSNYIEKFKSSDMISNVERLYKKIKQ
ncbi:glycosyltransferase [Klebsiella pneumoniae]|uniref:glycosyltransferase n=1 Tax=Klebsiella pneumoniae TaxID=573 RepID=UPI002875AD91|nr:glycosyltransferase [Klebsiella pneumoniae]MDS0460179.1 glycosyltransferase [Klebsiella pneumoniae]MDS0507289.1 glycosyltransferase [Klebsiella pneumoniae]MDU9067452.1 glycosyltransferase [Klebsiella pneumoniae]MDU9078369.1 glycosyltransferase [Klebsiella pneumoniae]HBS2478901.1 glycosyltransferase [Klebsiella pneumoniae]